MNNPEGSVASSYMFLFFLFGLVLDGNQGGCRFVGVPFGDNVTYMFAL